MSRVGGKTRISARPRYLAGVCTYQNFMSRDICDIAIRVEVVLRTSYDAPSELRMTYNRTTAGLSEEIISRSTAHVGGGSRSVVREVVRNRSSSADLPDREILRLFARAHTPRQPLRFLSLARH